MQVERTDLSALDQESSGPSALRSARSTIAIRQIHSPHAAVFRRDSAGAVAPSSSGRRLFIISRDHPKLYERAFKAFGGTRDTQVIYDRRRGQRRRGEPASATERRCGDRRQQTDVDFDIKAYGSAMVRP